MSNNSDHKSLTAEEIFVSRLSLILLGDFLPAVVGRGVNEPVLTIWTHAELSDP